MQRLPLFLQIWLENQLLAVVALLTAWLLVEASQIPVSQLMGERIGYSAFDWQISLGFLVLLPLVTSVYPYIKYNYLSPIASIRFDFIESPIHHYPHGIPVLQYIITILLLVLSLYFGKQLTFYYPPSRISDGRHPQSRIVPREHKSSRARREADRNKRAARYSYIKQQLNECPYIEMWMNSRPSILRGRSFCTLLNDKDTRLNMLTLFPSPNFFHLYDLKVLEGEIPQKFESWSDYKTF